MYDKGITLVQEVDASEVYKAFKLKWADNHEVCYVCCNFIDKPLYKNRTL